jgi:16S rRNA A1518/A1519 N6-dimethyltransferase RsmA/KsgA/DIM1 with predicted DNA glycosylase/AP lyase activity
MIQIEIFQHKGDRFMYMDDYLWMWDTQQEKELQKELADQAYGDVLIAGYGFGLLPEYLLKNPKVTSITTIEKYEHVIHEMNLLSGRIYGKIIIGDFFDMDEGNKYDCIIGDIWPDISTKFLGDYLKFKNKSLKMLKNNGSVLAWGKDFFEYLLQKK